MPPVQKWSGRETRALRHAMRLSARAFAAYLGVSGRTVTKWESGGALVHPRPEMQAALDTAHRRIDAEARARFELILHREQTKQALPDRTDPEVAAGDDAQITLAARATMVGALESADRDRTRAGDQEVSTVPSRRELLGYVGTSVMVAGLEQAAAASQRGLPLVLHALEATRSTKLPGLDTAAVAGLHTLVEHYKRTFRSTSPEKLYNDILCVRVHAGSLLDDNSASKHRHDLAVVVGWLSNLLALVTHDLDDRAAALVWCADAERRSQEAGHPELAGWAAQTKVLMSFYDGQAREAVNHARKGQQTASPGTVAHAKLLAHEMRAWALLGNAHLVIETRRRVEKAIAKLPSEVPTHGAFSISLSEDPPYTATSLLLLGRFREAAEATERVIATFYGVSGRDGPAEHPSGFARTYLILALALAGVGKPDEALAAGSRALNAPRLVWPVPVLASRLDQELTHNFAGSAEARDYHEQYVAAMQHSRSGHGSHGARPPVLTQLPHDHE